MKLRICKQVLRNKNYYYCKCNFRKNHNFLNKYSKNKKIPNCKMYF